MKKFIWFVIISGIILAVAGFFYWQKNPFSKDIIKLEIIGPEEANLTDEVEYTVKYKNNGDIKLEQAKLVFEFPDNTILEEGQSKVEKFDSDKLGDIYPGEEKVFTFKGRLLGKEGDIKTAKAFLNYKPKGLSAGYSSKTEFATVIKNVPFDLTLNIPPQLQPNQNFDFSINYSSNSDYAINNLAIKVEYPSGFDFTSGDPKTLGNTEWQIPNLKKSDSGKISIKGKITGEVKEKKTFKAILGVWKDNSFVSIKEASFDSEIINSSIQVYQRVNGENSYIANPGDSLHYEIFFRNAAGGSFTNLSLQVRLEGRAFDFDSIKINNGEFSMQDNILFFSGEEIPKLQFLGKDGEGKVEFWINLKKDWQTTSQQEKNFIVRDTVLLSGASTIFETKINTKMEVSQQALYDNDFFENLGSFPAKQGETTTFAVVWQFKNFYNGAKNIKIKAVLPKNVSLGTQILPESEKTKLTFNSSTREVIWSVSDGALPAGTGIFNVSPKIVFQVSLNAISGNDTIIGQAKITAEDQWTGESVSATTPAVSASSVAN